ncbi:MAG TPA: type 4a pilus biogenesis protein PilO [Terriglobales bacterium]|nr:type 4a pilus biogenesis protein PilO [Terriglobales bacterium]
MKWSELSAAKQLGIFIVVALVISGVAYYFADKPVIDANDQTAKQTAAVKAENDSLRPYEHKIRELEQQIENLKQQLEIQKRIVPDEKEADNFIRLVQTTAAASGVEVRLYSAKQTTPKEFYVEAPFDLNLDGPYYSMLNFFDRLAKQERIVTVSNLQMASVEKSGPAKVRHQYAYAPSESVVASCTATTYFSRDAAPAPAGKPAGR